MLSTTKTLNLVAPNDGDEIYCGGVVQINVTALLEWVNSQTSGFVAVSGLLHYLSLF